MDGLGRWLKRFRPYVVVAVAVAVVALAPARDDDDDVATDDRAAAAGATGAVDTGDAGGAGVDTALAAASGNTVAAARGAGQRAVATMPGARAAATAVATGKYPGIGTPEALANPNCDRERGRIKFPLRYAPLCVVPWPAGADNGGATSRGVTDKVVRFAVYAPPSSTGGDPWSDSAKQLWRDVFDIFNDHYEMWGRTIELVFVSGSGTDEVAQRAAAVQVFNEIKPMFATTAAASAEVFSQEMAARGVVVINTNTTFRAMRDQAPYRWSFYQDDVGMILHTVEYAAKRLQGRPARWAGDATLRAQPRVFGLVYPDTWEKKTWDEAANRLGLKVATAFAYNPDDTLGFQERARVMVSKMKADGVTTVIDAVGLLNLVLTREATSQTWFPEWYINGWANSDTVIFSRLFDQQQWRNAFGFGPLPILVPGSKLPHSQNYEWHHGRPPPSDVNSIATIASAHPIAWMTAGGLQHAGPNLTPLTFRDGMRAFPPNGGVWCGCVASFAFSWGTHIQVVPGVEDFAGAEDVVEKWWDPSAPGTDELNLEGVGQYRKVDGGRRYVPGKWPSGEPKAFDPTGTVVQFEDWPEGEDQGSYAHQSHR